MSDPKSITRCDPIRENIFELTFHYAAWHQNQTDELQEKLIEKFEGSRGIFQWIENQAELFEVYWANQQEIERNTVESTGYYEAIDKWMEKAIAGIVLHL